MIESERIALVRDIKKAFKTNAYPRRLNIGDKLELQGLIGKTWESLTIKDLSEYHRFFFFSDEAFGYLLPGYLVLLLENHEEFRRTDVFRDLLRHLSQTYTLLPRRNLCTLFDKKQREIIRRFLKVAENLYASELQFVRDLALVDAKRKSHVSRIMEKRQNELLDLLAKAKEYWQICDE